MKYYRPGDYEKGLNRMGSIWGRVETELELHQMRRKPNEPDYVLMGKGIEILKVMVKKERQRILGELKRVFERF